MKQINKGIICLLSGMALFVSCNDEWDAHYDRNGSVPQVSLMDLLRNDASLSTFTQIVEVTGTDRFACIQSNLHGMGTSK